MCDCIEMMNEALSEHNARLDIPMQIDLHTGKKIPPKPLISIYKIKSDRRGKLPVLLANFCPFCGERYPDHAAEAAGGGCPAAALE